MDWPKQVIENKRILLDWYDRICQSGHGEILVEIQAPCSGNGFKGKIEIRPTPRIRGDEAQKCFEFKGRG